MQRRYVTTDVFAERPFAGNPLAVVLDAEGLSTAQMQAVANEFGYSETTFVLPARDAANTAHVRIFTPGTELPFAGHPNVGTAFVLASLAGAGGRPIDGPASYVFEEGAGLVPVTTIVEAGVTVGAELTAPAPLSRGGAIPVESRRRVPVADRGRRHDGEPRAACRLGRPRLRRRGDASTAPRSAASSHGWTPSTPSCRSMARMRSTPTRTTSRRRSARSTAPRGCSR